MTAKVLTKPDGKTPSELGGIVGTEADELTPRARERDPKIELTYVVIAVGVFIALTVAERYVWAATWFMTTFFIFGVWRIARGRFR